MSHIETFQKRILDWYALHGRKELPWQQAISPYRVWISEIMLQQTQVSTVISYFNRFIERFPTVTALANSELDEVYHYWTGLGYYARARHLHQAARTIRDDYQGVFPDTPAALQALPGIGRSTAGAIVSIAYRKPAPILDGNVKRVLCRVHGIAGAQTAADLKQLWAVAEQYTPKIQSPQYTQAMMDLGALICTRTRPACAQCPVTDLCHAFKTQRQGDFPATKKRAPLPIKQTYFFILQAPDQSVCLVKRAPTGIWGGLWGFPEVEVGVEKMGIQTWIKANLKGFALSQPEPWPAFRHTFSHFHLDIQPIFLRVRAGFMKMARPSLGCTEPPLWYHPSKTKTPGFPTPVVRLLKRVFDFAPEC